MASEAKFEAIHRALELPLEQLRPSPDQQQAFYREVDGLRSQVSAHSANLDEVDTDEMSKGERKAIASDKRELTQILKNLDALEEHGARFINMEGGAYAS
jgi:hypothetical protein